jgi:CYTH domain-containing protein
MKTTRRFLLASSLARLLARDRGIDQQIVEGYLSAQPGKNQFVRLEADQCHVGIVPLGSAQEPMEELAPVPRAHAEALFDLCVGQISYDRLHLSIRSGADGHEILLDRIVYPESCDVLTVEFEGQQQAQDFEPPPWFGPEVTSEPAHERRYIALNGLAPSPEVPLSNLQLAAVLDLLDQAKLATDESRSSAAREVVVALARSLEASRIQKATPEPAGPSSETAAIPEELRRSAQ